MDDFDDTGTPTEERVRGLIEATEAFFDLLADYCQLRARLDGEFNSPGATSDDIAACEMTIYPDRITLEWTEPDLGCRCGQCGPHYREATIPLAHLWDPMAQAKIEAEVLDHIEAKVRKVAEEAAKRAAAQEAKERAELERLQEKYGAKEVVP